jgi:hypothetical protein
MPDYGDYRDVEIGRITLSERMDWSQGLQGALERARAPEAVRRAFEARRLGKGPTRLRDEQTSLVQEMLKRAAELQEGVEVVFEERAFSSSDDQPDGIITVRYEPIETTGQTGATPEERFYLRVTFA